MCLGGIEMYMRASGCVKEVERCTCLHVGVSSRYRGVHACLWVCLGGDSCES